MKSYKSDQPNINDLNTTWYSAGAPHSKKQDFQNQPFNNGGNVPTQNLLLRSIKPTDRQETILNNIQTNLKSMDQQQLQYREQHQSATARFLEKLKNKFDEKSSKQYGKLPRDLHKIYTGSEDLFYMAQIQKQYQNV